MKEEYGSIIRNNTWELTNFHKNKVPIGSKWLFKPKFKAYGSVDRYKVRLVAKGYLQNEVIDYDETSAPIDKLNAIRLMIDMAIEH